METNANPDGGEVAHDSLQRQRRRILLAGERVMQSPLFLWDWGEAIAIQALMVASETVGEPQFEEWATSRLDLWRQIHPDPFWPDHLGPGVALIWQYERTGNPDVLEYAERVGQHLRSLPRAQTGGRLLRPDKPDIDHFVWVDSLYTDGPFLGELGRVTVNETYYDEAASHTEGMCNSLQDAATGLFAHRYDDSSNTTNGVFWGRGCGWAALGLGHTLALIPQSHPQWNTIAQRFQRFAVAAAELQSPTGLWNAVLDKSNTLLEASTTALIGEGLARGIECGALGPEYDRTVKRAWDAVATAVDLDGRVENVSQRSPSSTSWADYAALAHGGTYAWGQGPWLLFACRFLAGGQDKREL